MIKSLITVTFILSSIGSSFAETTTFPADQKVLFTRGKLEIVEPGGDGKKKKVIEHKDKWGVKRYRIPHITKTPDGKLVVAIVGRCSVGGDHGKSTTFFAVSKDDGKSWTYVRHNTDYENKESRPKTDFPLTERTQETQVVWYPSMKKYVATYLTNNAAWFTTSADLKVWSAPIKSTFDGHENCKYWPSPASLQIDKDGSLMFAITGDETKDGKKQRFARIMWTKDLKTFESSPSMPCLGNETAVCPVGDGKYFVTTRIKPKRLNMTYDRKAKSWSKPMPFPQPAHWRCEVDVINAGDTLYLTTPTKGRAMGTLYSSKDKGTTWEKVTTLTEGAFAYSSLVKINDTTLGVVAERDNGDIVFQKVMVKK
jgi:hypothetical protein